MALETSTPRSRRAFLGASLAGGLAALAAQALGRPTITRGADGDPITVGGSVTGTKATIVQNTSETAGGIALMGIARNGTAIYAEGSTGVWASSELGTGLHADGAAWAARFHGRVAFHDRSGRTMIPAGRSYVDIAPGNLDGIIGILATLQAHRSGVYVTSVRGNYPSKGKARIRLNKVASSTLRTPVTWFVLG